MIFHIYYIFRFVRNFPSTCNYRNAFAQCCPDVSLLNMNFVLCTMMIRPSGRTPWKGHVVLAVHLFLQKSTKPMAVHSFWIFNRHTLCVFHREYNHQTPYKPQVSGNTTSGAAGTGAGAGAGTDKAVRLYPGRANVLNDSNESKLLYGMIHSLRNIANELTLPKQDGETSEPAASSEFGNSLQLNNNNKVYTLNTLHYKMQILETLSGLKMVVLTDVAHRNLLAQLQSVYTTVWVPLIVDNGMAAVELAAGEVISPSLRGDVSAADRRTNHREAAFVSKVDALLLS